MLVEIPKILADERLQKELFVNKGRGQLGATLQTLSRQCRAGAALRTGGVVAPVAPAPCAPLCARGREGGGWTPRSSRAF
eukprot:3156571-Alexandrium_andersonii.AAC.1